MLPVHVACGGIVLRPFASGDAPRVVELCGVRDVAETTALIPHPYPLELAEEWIASLAHPSSVATDYVYAVLRRTDALLVGAIGLHLSPGATDTFGYWIGRPHWNQGHATDAASAVLALGFTQLGLEAMHAAHLVRNPASGRVLQKCGLQQVRTERRPHRGGAEETFLVWCIERDAWQAAMDGASPIAPPAGR